MWEVWEVVATEDEDLLAEYLQNGWEPYAVTQRPGRWPEEPIYAHHLRRLVEVPDAE